MTQVQKAAAHSRIGASSMYRWSACPGSVRLSSGIEQKSSSYAEEGTTAHELAAKWLEAGCMNFQDPDPRFTPEMKEAVEVYFNVVWDESRGHKLYVEQRFDLSEIHPGLFGTSDAIVYDAKQKLLRVYDYKHGAGILVEVENNSQLMYYGLGALLSTKAPVSEIELVIVQPRAEHVDGVTRRWRFRSFDLVEFSADLHDFAKATTEPNAPLVSGDHCRFCPASGICPELRKKSLAVAQTEFKPTLSYDPVELSETLTKIDMLEAYAKSVRAFAYAEAEHGRCPPGWKLVAKRASRKWRAGEEETAKLLQQRFGLKVKDILDAPALKSVAQVEKLFSKEKKSELAQLVVSVSSGLALVEESDSRPPAIVGAESEFTKIEEKP